MENGLEGNETGCRWMRMVVNYPNFLETPKAGETRWEPWGCGISWKTSFCKCSIWEKEKRRMKGVTCNHSYNVWVCVVVSKSTFFRVLSCRKSLRTDEMSSLYLNNKGQEYSFLLFQCTIWWLANHLLVRIQATKTVVIRF